MDRSGEMGGPSDDVVRMPRLRPPATAASATQGEARKTKSAEIERPADYAMASMDEKRPTTGSSGVSSLSGNGRKSRSKNVKKTFNQSIHDPATASTDTLMDGWGDFDSDRLFRPENVAVNDGSDIRRDGRVLETRGHEDEDTNERLVHDADAEGERSPDEAESQPKSQRQRLEELARRASKPSSQSNLIREVPKQVLRQRTLAVMELEAPAAVVDVASPTNIYKNTPKKPLISYRRAKEETSDSEMERETYLPKIKKGSAVGALSAMTSPRQVGLLGQHIADSTDSRMQVHERFLPVWSLMSSRGVSSFSGNGMHDLTSHPNGVSSDSKSPFECSMVLMKICKTIGISLSSSLSPDAWCCVKKRPGRPKSEVEFDAFCDFVVRNALQPALHHFHLDRDMDVYIHTVDTIVQSLLIKDSTEQEHEIQWRIRELSEIQAVLPHWKKGILAVQSQNPMVKMSPSVAIISPDAMPVTSKDDTYAAIVSVDEVQCYSSSSTGAVALPANAGASTSATRPKKLPAHEARVQQDANIRRKIQLRTSWQPRIVVADSQPQQQQQQEQFNGFLGTRDVDSDPDRGDALGSCMRVESMAVPPPSSRPFVPGNSSTIDEPLVDNNDEEDEDPAKDQTAEKDTVILLCGICEREEEATLWCSTCFAVYCNECWTSKHHSVVDMTQIPSHYELPVPSARPMRTNRDRGNNQCHHKPPVDMVYLPTKPLMIGKRLRGPISTHRHPANQEEEPGSSDGESGSGGEASLSHGFSSHAILPTLRPVNAPRGLIKKKSNHHQSSPTLDTLQPEAGSASPPMESTANLLKVLMLGTASSVSVLGSLVSSGSLLASSSVSTTTKRIYKDPAKRKKLHPAAVTLDADAIFQTNN